MEDALDPTADPAWVLSAEGYDALREGSIESRFAISNGFLGVRATRAITRGARWIVSPRTYVAGLFDMAGTTPAIPELVPAADWLNVSIRLPDGLWVQHPGDVSTHRMTLDLRRGVLLTEARQTMARVDGIYGRTLRLVSLSERGVGLQLIELEFGAEEIEVTLEARLKGISLGLTPERLEQDLGVWHTLHSGKRLAIAIAASLRIDGHDIAPSPRGPLRWAWTWKSRAGQIVHFERFVAVARGNADGSQIGREAQGRLGIARQLGWRGVLAEHEAAWRDRWQCSDIDVAGDAAAQQALRFAAYHLNSAANPADEYVSIGARALTGDDYHGHVFWDTEIYLLPFYILTWPEAARALLMYRYHTIAGARAKAAAMGWRGAMYAWESADTGAEATPKYVVGPDRQVVEVVCADQEQHISADVAYAVWQYWHATGDDAFLLDAGAEILFETARFWASRAQREADGRCHIRGVMGPDEYHDNIDDSAFTNVMARWNIRRALDVAALLRERWPERWVSLSSRLVIDDSEMARWRAVAETLASGLDAATGLFEQFSGYFGLEAIDLEDYAGRSVPMDSVLGRERTRNSQVIKQADVVALLGLLPEEFVGTTAAENYRYYEPRCSHGSSLSYAMHALVAARLGCKDAALRHFRQTAAIDLADTHAAIDGGVHIAALGGLWQTAVLGFAGLSLHRDGVELNPRLPELWRVMSFRIQWRGRHLGITIDQGGRFVEATLKSGAPMAIRVNGKAHQLGAFESHRIPL